jgi:sucrose-6-phosphate hydrolase SacC (GH32 family)
VITADDRGRLCQTPHESVEGWFEPIASAKAMKLEGGVMKSIEATGLALRIRIVFHRAESRRVTLRLRASNDGQEYTDIHYEWESGRVVLDKTRSSLNHPERKKMEEANYLPDIKDRLELVALLDHSVLEVFLDSRSAFADRVYPSLDTSGGVAVGSDGGAAEIESLSVARLRGQA